MNKAKFTRGSEATQNVPTTALRFAADLDIGSNGDGNKTAPVKIKARSGQPVDHYWWGRMVHDMAGFSAAKAHLPIDYCHSDCEILGYANKFDTAGGELVASGAMTPFDEKDRATEVLFKSKQGVPYEASIYFDPDKLVLEYVPEGMSVAVNGYQFEGPGVVARQWTLRGIAICPHGYDSNTAVEFSKQNDSEVTVKFTNSDATPAPADESAPAEGETETPAEAETAVDAEQGEDPETPEEGEPVTTPAAPVESATALSRASEGQKFLTAFGDKGGKWFAEGKTFDEAQALFTAELQAENDALKQKMADLETKLSATRGEPSPVTFQTEAPANAAAQPTARQEAALGPGLAKFAAHIASTRKN